MQYRNPQVVKNAYTPDSIWRNRDTFLQGHDEIVEFLSKKWAKENGYRLRKELFAFKDNKVPSTFYLLPISYELWKCKRGILIRRTDSSAILV